MRFVSGLTLAAAHRAGGGSMSLSTSTMNEKDLDIDKKRATPVLSYFTRIGYDAVRQDRIRIFFYRVEDPLHMHRRVFKSDDGHRSSRLRRASTKISLFCLIIEMFTFWEVLSLQTLLNFFASAGHHHPRVKVIFSLIVFKRIKL